MDLRHASSSSGPNQRSGGPADPSRLALTHSRPTFAFPTRTTVSGSTRFLQRVLTLRSKSVDSPGELKFDHHGGLGLKTLFTPSDPLIEYVFVHGLGGGSTKTWCIHPDPSYFWPKEWLPRHADFKNVRIHSYGYASDWLERGRSSTDARDFGQALLLALRNSKCFSTNPIVVVAHSMGGIVAKEAYIMARQDPACHDLASRIVAMVFLATPHRGSELASYLNKILRVSPLHGSRPYLSDIERCSASLVKINDTFRHFCNDLILYSYFESRELSLGIAGSALIVPKDSAIMGLPGERVSLLNADHRTICKFHSLDSPEYNTLTDAFGCINNEISKKLSAENSSRLWDQLKQIETFLGMPQVPEDDLNELEDIRIPGSCDWFTDRDAFQTWVSMPPGSGPMMYWVYAKPAVGKSVLASHIIKLTNGLNDDCSYFFFRHGDKVRSTFAGCLLSLAYQMAILNLEVRKSLLIMIERGIRFENDNAKSIWRKIFEQIFGSKGTFRPQFWVLDALDECTDIPAFFAVMRKLDISLPIKILVTSRRTEDIVTGFAQLDLLSPAGPLLRSEIRTQDTRDSIFLYLKSNQHKLHADTDEQRQLLLTRIVDKAQGCFLWVRLVLEELSAVWTIKQIEQILHDVPQGMDQLYSRAIKLIAARPPASIAIAKAILVWTLCVIRPLTVAELQAALSLDIETSVQEPEEAIPSLCSQLVYVDKNGRVLMVHLTAKTFLQDRGLESPVAICPILCHRRIVEVCLRLLVSDEMKPQRTRRGSAKKRPSQQQSAILSYAAFNFAEHMRRTTSNNAVIAPLLHRFLEKNIFTWIEMMARNNGLDILPVTARLIKNYYERQAKFFPPLVEQVRLAESWIVDLHRLVAKFGTILARDPSSIHSLIPPFCPASSAIAAVFGKPHRRIHVLGLNDTGWDDRMACIDSHDTQAYALASGERYFAVGFGTAVVLCHAATCQRWKSLEHESVVRLAAFDLGGNILISAGRRNFKVWNIEENTLLLEFAVEHDILSFSLCDGERGLIVALKNNSTVTWSLESGEMLTTKQWMSAFADEGQFRRPPLLAAFSPDQSVIAVAYRGRPIKVLDLEDGAFVGLLGRELRDLSSLALGSNTSPSSMVFNSEESVSLLAVAYEDGDLCLFDYEELTLVRSLAANAQVLACSPNGQILATGNSAGVVQLLEFETLELLFKVNAVDYGIRSLAFSSDSTRFMDVRGTQCNVWEPVLPSGRSRHDDASSNSKAPEARIVGVSDEEVEITTIAVEGSNAWFFVGKSDGSVWLNRVSDGQPQKLLYRHGYEIAVTLMIWGDAKEVLVTADSAGRFIVSHLARDGAGGFHDPTRRLDVKGDVRHRVAISQILLNKPNDLLLISTVESDRVWDLDKGNIVSSCRFDARPSFDWVNNPLNQTERMLVGLSGAAVWDWRTCTLKVPETQLKLAGKALSLKPQSVKSVTEVFDANVLVEYCDSYSESSTTQVLLLDAKNIAIGGGDLAPSEAFATICGDLLHLVGTFGSRIVFLDKRLGICSVEFRNDKRPVFRRATHFFVPADWFSRRRTPRARVTGEGDVLFVRTEEVAVIKHGLLFEEEVTEVSAD